MVLTFPQEDLLFSLDDFNQDITFLFLKLGDLVLEFDRLVLHLLELLFEFHLDVKVVIGELLLMLIVLVDQVIELVHFEDLVLLGDFQLSNLLVVTFNRGINADFLLIEDRFLGTQVVVVAIDAVSFTLALD